MVSLIPNGLWKALSRLLSFPGSITNFRGSFSDSSRKEELPGLGDRKMPNMK